MCIVLVSYRTYLDLPTLTQQIHLPTTYYNNFYNHGQVIIRNFINTYPVPIHTLPIGYVTCDMCWLVGTSNRYLQVIGTYVFVIITVCTMYQLPSRYLYYQYLPTYVRRTSTSSSQSSYEYVRIGRTNQVPISR